MSRRILTLLTIALAITLPLAAEEKVVQFGFSAPGGAGLRGDLEHQIAMRLATGEAVRLADGDGVTVDARTFRFLTIITDPDRASGVFTPSDNPADTETVTIAATVYTAEDGTVDAGEFELGEDLEATLANLCALITADHATVTCTGSDATALTVVARTAGSGANTIATTDTVDGGWAAATLADVVDPIVTYSVVISPNATSHAYTASATTLLGTVTGTVPTLSAIDVKALTYRVTSSGRSFIELVP